VRGRKGSVMEELGGWMLGVKEKKEEEKEKEEQM
jgi:hypothetical protein